MSADSTLHLGDPVDAQWASLSPETRVRRWNDGEGDAAGSASEATDADGSSARATDADPNGIIVRLRDAPDASGSADHDPEGSGASGESGAAETDGAAPETSDSGPRDGRFAAAEGAVAIDRLEAVRARYPRAEVLAYSVRNVPDAAIDASRLGRRGVRRRHLVRSRARRERHDRDARASGGGRSVVRRAASRSERVRRRRRVPTRLLSTVVLLGV